MVEDTDHLIDEMNAATLAETRRPDPTPLSGRAPIEPVFRYTRVKPCGCDDDGTVCLHGIPAVIGTSEDFPLTHRVGEYLGIPRPHFRTHETLPIEGGFDVPPPEAPREWSRPVQRATITRFKLAARNERTLRPLTYEDPENQRAVVTMTDADKGTLAKMLEWFRSFGGAF